MKILLIIFIAIISIGLIYFFYLGYKSQAGSPNGLTDSKLTPCSKKPNCICTEYPADSSHFTDAIKYQSFDFEKLIQTIKDSGGVISHSNDHYIAATYTSTIFRYVDDFELRIDTENQLIHIRSASRVGHSDMGANLKRIQQFRQRLSHELNSSD